MHVGPDVASRGRASREFRFGKLFISSFSCILRREEKIFEISTRLRSRFLFHSILFYFILLYFIFFFIFFLFFVCFMMRAERFVEARHLRADTIPCCFHADVLRLPSSSASVDSVAASPMSPRGYLLRDGGCWSAATPSSFFFFFFFGRWSSRDYFNPAPSSSQPIDPRTTAFHSLSRKRVNAINRRTRLRRCSVYTILCIHMYNAIRSRIPTVVGKNKWTDSGSRYQ